jgi:hypothetical protein
MIRRLLLNIDVLLLAVFVLATIAIPVGGEGTGIGTDRRVYPAVAAPVLPKAPETFVDPTFGTTIMRVTDENDGKENANAYSYWPSFNKDSTRFHINSNGRAITYRFDPAGFKILSKEPLFVRNPLGETPRWEDCIWSGAEPNALYAHTRAELLHYDVAAKRYAVIKNFTNILPQGGLIQQMSKSADDNVFAFSIDVTPGDHIGYLVWQKDADSILAKQIVSKYIDEVQVDKSGKFLVIKTGQQGKGQVEVQIADLAGGKVENLIDNPPDSAPGHSDNGDGIVIGADNWENRITFRRLTLPHQVRSVLELKNDWSQDYHISLLADDEEWVLVSFYKGAEQKLASSGVFLNEIVQVATDGSGRVRRLAQHRSVVKEYWDSPRANISRDGRFVIFTSNWQAGGQRDVFILKVPQ